jgi:hypothetical protein
LKGVESGDLVIFRTFTGLLVGYSLAGAFSATPLDKEWSEGKSPTTVLKLQNLQEQHPSSVVKPLVNGRLSSNSLWKGLLVQRRGGWPSF